MAGTADEPARTSGAGEAASNTTASKQTADVVNPPPSNTASDQGTGSSQAAQSAAVNDNDKDERGTGSGQAAQSAAVDDDDDDETCGFCIFMKAGGCKAAFTDWSNCVDQEREKGGDFASDCREKTFALRECMLEHKEYYAPVLGEEEEYVADKKEAAQSS